MPSRGGRTPRSRAVGGAREKASHERGRRGIVKPLAVEALPGPEVEGEGDDGVGLRSVEVGREVSGELGE